MKNKKKNKPLNLEWFTYYATYRLFHYDEKPQFPSPSNL